MQTISSALAPEAIGPYSQAVVANGFIFVSGQLPIATATGELIGEVSNATLQSLANISAVLESAGSSMKQVVKTTVFLRDLNDFSAMNEAYSRYFDQSPPARSTVQAGRLPKDAVVEIEAIACIG